jgi:RHS repeat-associated protein
VTGTSIGTGTGQVTTSETPNAFAELDSESASISGALVYQTSYGTRDALGRIVDLVETIQGTTTTYHYAYDAAGRLQTVTVNGSTSRSYGYDLNGNRTQVDGVTIATTDAQDRLTAYGSKSYAYTRSGELSSKTDNTTSQTTLYTYDPLSSLRNVTLPDGTQIDYVIDGQNRRVGKQVNGVLTQGWLYADQLRIVAELDGASNVVSRFVYGSKVNVPDYMTRNGITYRILSDHLGSPRLVVDTTTGQVVQRTDYDEWGNVTNEVLAPGWLPIPFGFAGGLYDRDTKLVRFGARDYDPEVGRWTTTDPIGFLGGTPDLFVYGIGDPINSIDYRGTWTVSLGISVNFQIGPVAIGISTGVAADESGGLGTYTTFGGGGGVGSDVSGGLTVAVSNAKTICDLSGPFDNFSADVGSGLNLAGEGFGGAASDGSPVIGAGLTLGVGGGAGTSVTRTNTRVERLF